MEQKKLSSLSMIKRRCSFRGTLPLSAGEEDLPRHLKDNLFDCFYQGLLAVVGDKHQLRIGGAGLLASIAKGGVH